MRILVDARAAVPDSYHGIARHALGLLDGLIHRPAGHTYVVLTGDRAIADKLKKVPDFEVVHTDLILYTPTELMWLPRLVKGLKPDLYYSPTFMPLAWSKTPVAFTIHDLIHLDWADSYPLSRRMIWKWLITPKARQAQRVLTGSMDTANRLIAELGIDSDRVVRIGHGIDADFRPRSQDEIDEVRHVMNLKGPYVVTSGNSRPHKNLNQAIRAFHRLVGNGYQGSLAVVGAGDMALHRGRGRVVGAPKLTDAQLAALYSGADGAVIASLAEGFGFPPLEALASGCPVTVSDIEVVREVVGIDSAFLVDPSDVTTLAAAMDRMVNDKTEAARRAEVGRARALEHTWEQATTNLLNVFDSIQAELGL